MIREIAVSSDEEPGALERTIEAVANYIAVIDDMPEIKEAGGIRAYTESSLREEIIDPILLALGWDVNNRKRVKIERRVDYKMKSDYLLLHSNGASFAVIEAKNLDEKLENHENQLFGYMDAAYADTGVLTNGFAWKIYKREDKKDFDVILHIDDILVEKNGPALKLLCNLIGYRKNFNSFNRKPVQDRLPAVDDGWVEFQEKA